eukprot:CAMPEP_0176031660 /NCGR_PEP_ID=MMETSP0120_2-20121206/15612_1 /TAXON_ID=160619 /ORGANISM="Kryptoperidinium foliaceum, Strain CCMP 1326" /LENGTH=220 /DNA_ID=CAMNT_0017364957 /DNA_START=27 /DNA_END=686 /DNA_ORIENTATION=+
MGHVIGGATDPNVKPASADEQLFCVMMLASSVLVVGAGISNMTNAIAELQRLQMEAKDTKRRLSQVLIASNADVTLAARVLRFGRASQEAGIASWLDSFANSDMWDQYLHCMYWSMGHIIGGATDPHVKPQSWQEQLYCVIMLAFSLLVVGAGISNMTNAIAELQRLHMEAKDTKRRLSQVLIASKADASLTARVLRFGMHSFRRKASLSVEGSVMGLLS